ncbi:hypothetical protein XAP412_170003 [Xanthomonas phaseoli pv. phaseoli]|uniref:Uncharacterized protein n=1 Tax=Xanthomonas campestris pv. phaseoli TaxID=317013 RepID=A0AB38DWM6_XANCH|nr:hypothetical protein XAP6984_240003 [Xanthomonas phaseoli pv. phaseoli]SON80607.1 hypothetical protein XAP412_170003 [Xanthomonas phaseoli pv. phaseoli]SON84599.1 hypothetical protein XAP7430_190003 [Xanthomonas phaseoli pv. phaseoli]
MRNGSLVSWNIVPARAALVVNGTPRLKRDRAGPVQTGNESLAASANCKARDSTRLRCRRTPTKSGIDNPSWNCTALMLITPPH